jgi:hypothetical protein
LDVKPYYEDDSVTIYHGDCRDILPLDCGSILTDPPYGINLQTNYHTRGRAVLADCRDYPPVHGDTGPFDPSVLLSMDVPTIIWGGNYFSSSLPNVSGWLVWDKLRPEGLDQADAELAWTNCVKGVRTFHHLWHGMMRASEHGTGFHPTQKPVALMSWCIARADLQGPILDPYMGAGPALRAAKNLGRKAIGIEIEERYCEIAAKRMSQTVMALEV